MKFTPRQREHLRMSRVIDNRQQEVRFKLIQRDLAKYNLKRYEALVETAIKEADAYCVSGRGAGRRIY